MHSHSTTLPHSCRNASPNSTSRRGARCPPSSDGACGLVCVCTCLPAVSSQLRHKPRLVQVSADMEKLATSSKEAADAVKGLSRDELVTSAALCVTPLTTALFTLHVCPMTACVPNDQAKKMVESELDALRFGKSHDLSDVRTHVCKSHDLSDTFMYE